MDTFFSDKQQQSFWLSKIIFLSPCLHFNFFLVLLTADSKHELSQKRWRFSKWGSPFLGIPCSTSPWTGPWRIQFEKITKNLCSLSMDPPYILSRVCGECKSLNHSTGFEKPWTQRGVPGSAPFTLVHARSHCSPSRRKTTRGQTRLEFLVTSSFFCLVRTRLWLGKIIMSDKCRF